MRCLIDGLSFRPEVYARAKSILPKFEKPNDVAAANVQCITSLHVFSNSNPTKIHEFYEKMIVSVQALDTTHKLRDNYTFPEFDDVMFLL